jgi:hypothetical protein
MECLSILTSAASHRLHISRLGIAERLNNAYGDRLARQILSAHNALEGSGRDTKLYMVVSYLTHYPQDSERTYLQERG